MATGKTYYSRPSDRYLPTYRSYQSTNDSVFEFDESDLYSDSSDFRRKQLFTSSRRSSPATVTTTMAASLPINISHCSKIHRGENSDRRQRSIENDDEGDRFESGRLPPHEYLAKTRMASFSVHEGVGRTLKGRDLSRVRNAVFEKIGMLD